ncbi:MAG: bifunctional phosphopantothenoylcysteine decarboxylase/phosphopantothenate--cysteine ligase CoaBC [Clostridiales bacterium]|nr:bifunctional phosphopantothenoylcysteine decarboxylase/phosphopantothenate--cysteine ligase CoaBC [Clostridiales bacterium]
MLNGKHILLGVTGSIAAYKIANLASMLVKQHAQVTVLMTQNATNFINPITFETLTSHKCLVDTFDRNFQYDVQHVSLAKQADLFLVAPASADVIGKLANGIADDMLTTTFMACKCPKLVSPAMNTAMYENSIVQENIQKLSAHGIGIIEPAGGRLACGDTGMGKMPEPETLFAWILRYLAHEKDMAGKNVLISAGPTQEAIDPVRFITNHSTGKMGYALAENCMRRGAKVTLVSGPVSIEPPLFVDVVPVVSAAEMADAVKSQATQQDIIIMTAAVADYRSLHIAKEKIKKTEPASEAYREPGKENMTGTMQANADMSIPLERTEDILSYLGAHKKEGQFICGFSMETENMLENSKSKLSRKNADMIVANSLRTEGAGFGTDTNVVTLITKSYCRELPLMTKAEAAEAIIDAIRTQMEIY